MTHQIARLPAALAPDDSVSVLKARRRRRALQQASRGRRRAARGARRILPPTRRRSPLSGAGRSWRAPPITGNWLQRKIAGIAWRVIAPALERQQAFNGALVDHVNRGVPVDRATRQAIDAALRFTSDALGELRAFHSALIVYFQQQTAVVDTNDFEFAGHIRDRYIALDGAVAGLTDDPQALESMVAPEALQQATAIQGPGRVEPRVPRRDRGAAPGDDHAEAGTGADGDRARLRARLRAGAASASPDAASAARLH